MPAGTWGEWVAAVATFAAVLYALVIRELDHVRARKRARRAEAARVNVWHQRPGPEQREAWLLIVQNDSPDPIYRWDAAIWWRTREGGVVKYEHSDVTRGPLPPDSRLEEGVPGRAPLPGQADRAIRATIVWYDARGDAWLRHGSELRGPARGWTLPWLATPQNATEGADAMVRRLVGPPPRHRWWHLAS